jgi:hypothetical protein
MSSDADTSANITKLPGKPDSRNEAMQLAEALAERDRYFQELFAESRQSYAHAQQSQRLRYKLDNLRRELDKVYAAKTWRYTAAFRGLDKWWRGLFKKS